MCKLFCKVNVLACILVYTSFTLIWYATLLLSEKKKNEIDLLTPSQGSRVCVRTEYLLLWCSMLNSKSCGRSWSAHEGTNYAYTKASLWKNCPSSNCCHFVKKKFRTKLLHAYVQYVYIVAEKYEIPPSKAEVEAVWPMKALSIHIQKPYKWIIVLKVLTAVIFFNQTPLCICSMCLYCIGKVSNCSTKSCGRNWSANEGTIYAYTKAS